MAVYFDKILTFSCGLRPWKKGCSLGVILQWWKEGYLKSKGKLGHPMWMGVAHSTLVETEIRDKCLRLGFVHSVYPYPAGFIWIQHSAITWHCLQ